MKSLTVAQAIDKARFASAQAWLFAAKIYIKDENGLIDGIVRIVRNDEDIVIDGENYQAIPFELQTTESNGELPKFQLVIQDQLGLIQSQLNRHRGIVGSRVELMVITPELMEESFSEYDGSYPLPHVGTISVDDSARRIALPGNVSNPVVIHGVPTDKDPELGLVCVNNVTETGFDIRFQEWPYLDGNHGPEQVSYMVLPEGIHSQYDGSTWEVGKATADDFVSSLDDSDWVRVTFSHTHPQKPKLLVSIQGDGESIANVRVQNLDETGFDVGVQSYQGGGDLKPQDIGWVAISGPSSGEIKVRNQSGSVSLVDYRLREAARSDSEGADLGGFKLFVQEEQAADEEVTHATESISILDFEGHVFSSMTTFAGPDPCVLRRKDLGTYPFTPVKAKVEPDLVDALNVMSASAGDWVVTFDLGSDNPLRTLVPRRVQLRDRCSFEYKSPECGYTGSQPTCLLTLDDCRAHNNEQNFGGFPAIKPRSL